MITFLLALAGCTLVVLGALVDVILEGPARRQAEVEGRERECTFDDVKAAPVIDALRIAETYRRHRAEAIEALESVTA